MNGCLSPRNPPCMPAKQRFSRYLPREIVKLAVTTALLTLLPEARAEEPGYARGTMMAYADRPAASPTFSGSQQPWVMPAAQQSAQTVNIQPYQQTGQYQQPGQYPVAGYYPYYQPAAYLPEPTAPERDKSEREDQPEPPFLDLAVFTQVPLAMGGHLGIELPGRLLAQLEVGWMPPFYSTMITGALQSFGAYDGAMRAMIDGVLDDAVVVRATGGWRPFPSAGFEIFGGYTWVSLSGSVAPADVASVIGGELAADVAAELMQEDIAISSQLHNFHVGLGWRWVAFDHLMIRATLSYMQAVSSSTSIESSDRPETAQLASDRADSLLNDTYTSYVKLPLLGLSAGYRF